MSNIISAGGNGQNGSVSVLGADGQPQAEMLARADESIIAAGQKNRPGRLTLYNGTGSLTFNVSSKEAKLSLGGANVPGLLSVIGADGQPQAEMLARTDESIIAAGQTSRPGRLTLYNGAGSPTFNVSSKEAKLSLGGGNLQGHLSVNGINGESQIELRAKTDESLITAGEKDRPGRLVLYSSSGVATVKLAGKDARLFLGGNNTLGLVSVKGADGEPQIELLAFNNESVIGLGQKNRPGRISVYDSSHSESIRIDGKAGDILLLNADCAEEFDVEGEEPAPGMVVALAENGAVELSSRPYDGRVAGVVSGAGSYRPGLVMDRRNTGSRRVPVALLGKVYCRVDADEAPIQTGDLLTTASRPGHAMKVRDPQRAIGSIIGKALEPLAAGCALIPVLVALK